MFPFEHQLSTPTWPLQGPTDFADSLLWDLQRRYFSEQGREAWRNSEVPHYVTSNPNMARAYAEMIMSLWRAQTHHPQEPMTICELGAGSGRFCFHLLRQLHVLCAEFKVPPNAFRYVLTDYAESNLEAWLRHPSFAGWFEAGLLDVALFDVSAPAPLQLRRAGITITPGSLQQPLVVLANYLFDSIPQDLYYIDQGSIQRCQLALESTLPPSLADAAALLHSLQCRYRYTAFDGQAVQEPALAALLERYRTQLRDTHLLFPATGLRCLAWLRSLAPAGMLLLSADKGELSLERLQGCPAPEPERHGSISLQVNFHAMTQWCELEGGEAFLPLRAPAHLSVCALCLPGPGIRIGQLRRSYEERIQDFSPDDFYSLSLHLRDTADVADLDTLLAFLRLARDDAHQLGRYLPRITALVQGCSAEQRAQLIALVQQTWENYFPLDEELDLANHIGYLLYWLGAYRESMAFYRRSQARYGEKIETLFNLGLCHQQCREFEAAAASYRAVLAREPGHEDAAARLAELAQAAELPAAGAARQT